MEFLTELWLPIVLSAVFVFLVSSIVHMVLPIHKSDLDTLPGEEEIRASMRAQGVQPGYYMIPGCSSQKEMASEEMMAKLNEGPVGWLTVLPNGPWNMGKSLGQWFAFCLVVGACVAYLASHAVPAGSEYLHVFRITGTVAFLVHGVAQMPASIWKGQPWSVTGKFVFDGLLYGLTTAGTFAWLWPEAAA